MVNAYTSTIVIEAAPEDVFEFVSNAENQTQWAVNFVRATRPVSDGTYVMDTPVGELRYRLDADADTGVVDWVFLSDAGENVLPARVVRHPRGSLFTFTITRPPGASDEEWERSIGAMDEELGILKTLCER